jgi:preprotein translocase subunit SecG
MYTLLLLIHVSAAVFIITLVLIQQGKGSAMGAAFGSGASQTIFGSRGSNSFLLKLTIGFALIFFATSIALNYVATKEYRQALHVLASNLPAAPAPLPMVPTKKLDES